MKFDWRIMRCFFIKHSNLLIFRFQVGLSCVWLYITCIIIDIPLKKHVSYLQRPDCTELYWWNLRLYVKPHIDYHACQMGLPSCRKGQHLVQQGKSQEFLTGMAIGDLLWPAKRVQISISLRTCGRFCQDVSMVWIHYRKLQLSFMQRARWIKNVT